MRLVPLSRQAIATISVLAWGILQAPASLSAQAVAAEATPADCSKIWVGREAEFEEFLRTVKIERFDEIPVGVTKPKRAYFKPGGLAESGAWKPLKPGIHGGFWDSYKAEIAAYELDKLLGLQMVPPAVERTLDREEGALILWIERVKSWRPEEQLEGPDAYAWMKEVVRRKMFDNLIGNGDRNRGNLLYDTQFHLILIDHSRALTTSKDMPTKLTRLDRGLWERIDALTYEQLEPALAPWIGKGEIRAILARREKMRDEVKQLLAKASPYAVFLR